MAFDTSVYRLLARRDPDTRVSLAWAYLQRGAGEGWTRAASPAWGLVASPLSVEAGSGVWWQAREVQMEVYLGRAERAVASDGATADLGPWRKLAEDVHAAVTGAYPDLDDHPRASVRERWLGFRERLDRLPR